MNFLFVEIALKRIDQQLEDLVAEAKIMSFENHIPKQVYFDIPNAFLKKETTNGEITI